MKAIFLGLTLIFSTQSMDLFANHQTQTGKLEIQEIDALNVIRCKKNKNQNILPSVNKTITSSSTEIMLVDGSTVSSSITLTVLNKSKGLARIRIINAQFASNVDFLVGLVGNQYFGTSVDNEGTIVLERVSKNTLEATFTRINSVTEEPIQIRAKFKL